jgi:hypothetical protein
MSHLGALITPFVDGELSPARAAEARAHLSDCAECRRLLLMEQAARRRTQASAHGVQASAELTARLLAMPAGPMPAAAPLRPRRAPFVFGGGAALVGLFVLTLVVLGTPRADHPGSLLSATADADELTAPSATARATSDQTALAGWALPADHAVDSLDLLGEGETETLDVVIETGAGDVRLLERVGLLDDAAVADLPATSIAGRTTYLVDGWYVLESGPCVVAVLGDSDRAVETVIGQLPPPAPDGVLGRVIAGWHVLVG